LDIGYIGKLCEVLIKTGKSERIMQERMKGKELNRKEFFWVLGRKCQKTSLETNYGNQLIKSCQ